MLLELLIGGPFLVAFVAQTYYKFKESDSVPQLIQYIPTPPALPQSPVVQLVVELLRTDEGWRVVHHPDPDYSGTIYKHKSTGVTVQNVRNRKRQQFLQLSLLVDGDKVTLEDKDKEVIRAELKAYDTRAADRKQREIARVLAGRVLGAPVLGDDRVSDAEDDNVERNDPVSPNLLTFDPGSGKVIQIGGGDSGLLMDDELCARYGLPVYDPLCHRMVTRNKTYAHMFTTYKGVPLEYLPPSGDD